ncbi:MAG TPA: GNAT family N-acetyltransferase [Gammaproteobacteria bacterium]|nr:GNAT family N-acetyltransferase [Gammaproteobacteria bacterium]
MRLRTDVCPSIDALDAAEWNRLAGAASPFLSHAFLAALERHDCVGAGAGWTPCHVVASDCEGRLAAAMPLYLKTHSWGEFVFDWAWAQAYREAGLDYYPKLVGMVPFTPATTPRFLVRPGVDRRHAAARLLEAALDHARASSASSLHVLFTGQADRELLCEAGFVLRKDCQFHWHNRGYADFEDFLAGFASAKRKKIRRERRRIAESGVRFETLDGTAISEDLWHDIHFFCASTFTRRGQLPYLTRGFFVDVGRTLGDRLVVILARLSNRPVAAAICFRSDDTLYGRYWGSVGEMHSLHFETCYYQGIELCIRLGLGRFEPGTQGEHKVSRGFEPAATWSAHWLADPGFARAVRDFAGRERARVDAYMTDVDGHLPFRRALRDERMARPA